MERASFLRILETVGRALLVVALAGTALHASGQALPTPTPAPTDNTAAGDKPASSDKAAANTETKKENAPDEPAPGLMDQDPIDALDRIWNVTLFQAGDTAIKLNQIVIALIVAILGLWFAKIMTGFLSRRLVRTQKVSETIAYTIGKVVYYVVAAMILLIAMQVAGIPTTAFTVLGGALAIGVGFGAQNLFNNLISGIIILTEKPIRRRDIVVIDGMEGQVAEIGNRRTRIRRTDGVDVLVPNSKFLETNVINWTLHDALIRGSVEVGVAYGSPTKRVRELLLKVVEDHGRVNKNPSPVVLFNAFGDNTLNFAVYFWCEVTRPLDRRQIESDLRFMIDDLFHKEGIVIAFPQRDVHLNTLKPLEVRMIEGAASQTQPENEPQEG